MDIDDIIFAMTIMLSISVGNYYKGLNSPDKRRHFGIGLGVLITLALCGHRCVYSLLLVGISILIIKLCPKSYIRQVSLTTIWLYILYVHLFVDGPKYMTWIHQTLALRMVGLSFEVYASSMPCRHARHSLLHRQILTSAKTSSSLAANVSKLDVDKQTQLLAGTSGKTLHDVICSYSTVNPSFMDIVSYAYFYIGIHRGPYYKWKDFNDHFVAPHCLGDTRDITMDKLKRAAVCTIVYLILWIKYSSEVYYNKEFYYHYGTDYRFLYNVPQLLMYLLEYETIMLLSLSACSESGFGVYPTKRLSLQAGMGPSTEVKLPPMDMPLEKEKEVAMIKCFDNERLLFGPTMVETLKAWDMPTHYWFGTHINRPMLKMRKQVRDFTVLDFFILQKRSIRVPILFVSCIRSIISFVIWGVLRGPTLAQLLLCVTLWVYIHLEKEYSILYQATGSMKVAWDIGYSIMRMFCLVYLTPCLFIEATRPLIQYYCSIYWAFHLVLLFLLGFAVITCKTRNDSIF